MCETQLNFSDFLNAEKDGRTAAAWSVVMEHYSELSRYAKQMAAKTFSVNPDELLNEGIVSIITRFHKFNPAKGDVKTFCYFQMRRACTDLLRQAGVGRRKLCGMNPGEPDVLSFVPHEGYGDAERVEGRAAAVISLEKILPEMTTEELDCVLSKVNKLSGQEIREKFGVSISARNQRVYRLRKRLMKVGV